MPARVVKLGLPRPSAAEVIRDAFEHLRAEMQIPADFPAPVNDEAAEVKTRFAEADLAQQFPGHDASTLDIPFLTIDPEGSMDLDQALHIEKLDSGFRVNYAIADVATYVREGGAIDAEAQSRGMTLYAPDGRTPLHPPALSEDVASLLPDQVRAAAVWTIDLDETGKIASIDVRRGIVRSRARLSYVEAQALIEAHLPSHAPTSDPDGSGSIVENQDVAAVDTAALTATISDDCLDSVLLLASVGPLRQKVEQERGGVSLNVPEQEVHMTEDGDFELSFRSIMPVEDWNAQISLLTGMAGAQLMLKGGVGLLRTLPPADPRDLKRLRHTAHALGLNWRKDVSYGEFLDTLGAAGPREAAFQHEATTLFRGADYLAFTQESVPGENAGKHNAIGAHYAHVTAPLRRLGDRYTTEICLAIAEGREVPEWVMEKLPELPKLLADSGRRAGSYERATIDIVEAAVLADNVGDTFEGAIVEVEDRDFKRGDVMIADPAVHAQVRSLGELPLGEVVTVTLVEADIERRRIRFQFGPLPVAQGQGQRQGQGTAQSQAERGNVPGPSGQRPSGNQSEAEGTSRGR